MTICIEKLLRGPLKSAAPTAFSLGFILATISVGIADEPQNQKQLKNLNKIKHIIVIYQENWSFDSLYGSSQAPMASPIASTPYPSSTRQLSPRIRR